MGALQRAIRALTGRALVIQLVVDPGVMGVVVGREHAMLDQRPDPGRPEVPPEPYVVVPLVGGEAPQDVRISPGDLRPDLGLVGPFRATVEIKDRALSRVDEECRLERSDSPADPPQVVVRRLVPFKVRRVDGPAAVVVEELTRPTEQLPPDTHRGPFERLAEG